MYILLIIFYIVFGIFFGFSAIGIVGMFPVFFTAPNSLFLIPVSYLIGCFIRLLAGNSFKYQGAE